MTKVFLSYEREDLATARGLAVALEQNGHEVWWDRHIRGGTQYADEIEKALEAAEAVVVLWSKRSIASAWVRDEAAAGRDTGRLVPVSIDACTPPLGFRQYQTLHLPNGAGGNGAFEELNETITAMGSGIPHPNRGTERAAPSSRKLTRRHALIAGGSAAAVAAAGGGYWFYERSKQSDIPPEVAPLMLQARQLMNLNTREGQFMALGLYQRVTETVPDWADGWGWLGFTYGVMSHYAGGAESKSFRARAEAAGNRALQINPQSAFGELALGVAYPFIGYYGAREERLNRALSYKPDEDEILLVTAVFLQMVGRSTESVPMYQAVRRRRPFTPAEYYNYIVGLWNSGRLTELDQAINDAASLYPTQANIWYARVGLAMYDGDVGALTGILADKQSWPTRMTDQEASDFLAVTRAIQTKDPKLVQAASKQQFENGRLSAQLTELGVRTLTALGNLDDAFRLLDAYFFGREFVIPDTPVKGSGFTPEQRQTRILFQPVTKPLRGDPRFQRLVEELGLNKYWRESGKLPDYRHIAGL